jgi:glutamate N-acetyltransferase / amino-acid N-acetyltransferase
MKSNPIQFNPHAGVCYPKGFLASGIAAGIKKNGNRDLSLIVSETPCASAGTFTTNTAKAAPVVFDLELIRKFPIRGIVANSGNANASTGKVGYKNTRLMSEWAHEAATTFDPRLQGGNFLVCSTGRIGVQLPMSKVKSGIKLAAKKLSRDDKVAAEAIMTSDTVFKRNSVEINLGSSIVRIGGIAKGAGMIEPGMSASGKPPALHATMLCFLTTDAIISPPLLQATLNTAVGQSFNRIDVDGDMSTNDTVLLLANGQAGNSPIKKGSREFKLFQQALNELTLSLALMIVKDGEGISRIVTVNVTGAKTSIDAEKAVRAIANSTLAKCAWCGGDPNWGRLSAAIGYSGANYDCSKLSVKYNTVLLVKNGLQIDKNVKKARIVAANSSFIVTCDLGMGKHGATMYTTDLTEKYVEFNKGE